MGWAEIIGIGLQLWSANNAADATTEAAETYSEGITEAAKPKSVYDPTASAIWDEATNSYVISPSDPMMGLFNANLNDAYRQRKMIEEYMLDPEAAAQQRANKSIGFMSGKRNKLGQDLLGTLNRDGLLTSSFGADAISDFDTARSMEDYNILEANRTGVQSDITNYLNRSNSAQNLMKSYGSIGQNLANLGVNLGSNASTAYQQGGTALMNANANAGMAQAQLPYMIGQGLMNYNRVDPYKQLASQSAYSRPGPQGYTGSVW
jgi:hypothetical protein